MNLKSKLSKRAEQKQIINVEIIWRVISWEGEAGEWGKGAGIRKYKLVGTKEAGGC